MKKSKTNNISEFFNSLIFDRALLCISLLYIFFSMYSQYAEGKGFANKFCLNQFYMNYVDYGFVQRGLIGTIIRLTFGYYIPLDTMRKIVFFTHNIATIVLLLLIYDLKKTSYIPPGRAFMFRPVFFLTIFKVIPSVFSQHQGRLDVYFVICGVVCILLLRRNSRFVFLVPLICAVAMTIHPVFAFVFFPIVFIMMNIKTFLICGKRFSKSGLIVLLCSTFLVMVLLLYFSNAAYKVLPVDFDEAKTIFIERTCEDAVDDSFWNENNLFFRTDDTITIKEYTRYFNDQIRKVQLKDTLYKSICFSPFILFFFYIYIRWSQMFDGRFKRFVSIIIPFSVLVIIPLYVFEVDFGRWSMFFLFMIMCGLLLPDITVNKLEESPYYDMPVIIERIMSVLAIVSCMVTDYFYVSS